MTDEELTLLETIPADLWDRLSAADQLALWRSQPSRGKLSREDLEQKREAVLAKIKKWGWPEGSSAPQRKPRRPAGVPADEAARRTLSVLQQAPGPLTLAEIIRQTGLLRSAVTRSLTGLVLSGQIDRPGRGTYIAVPKQAGVRPVAACLLAALQRAGGPRSIAALAREVPISPGRARAGVRFLHRRGQIRPCSRGYVVVDDGAQ